MAKHKFDLSFLESPTQRFALLSEVFKVLIAKGIDPEILLKSLLKSSSGEITFAFGNTLMQLERIAVLDIYGKFSEYSYRDLIEISISSNSELVEKTVSCKYSPKDLVSFKVYQKTKKPASKRKKKQKEPKTKDMLAKTQGP